MVRKTVTVVFADLVGSTTLGERTDPEVLQELMAGYHAELRAILERHGGSVEKFVGDALHALPIADLLFDERGELRPLVNPFVDKSLERDLTTPLQAQSEVRVVAAIAGG